MKDRKQKTENATETDRLAPGLDGVEGLDRDATPEDIARRNFTEVTKLEYDEYDPSDD
ncbi:MAG: hypothetical protein K6T83_19775 [Alicyclobacillus sp.]|nr:hypothetical protein [Alicyclobacillus sp.]